MCAKKSASFPRVRYPCQEVRHAESPLSARVARYNVGDKGVFASVEVDLLSAERATSGSR